MQRERARQLFRHAQLGWLDESCDTALLNVKPDSQTLGKLLTQLRKGTTGSLSEDILTATSLRCDNERVTVRCKWRRRPPTYRRASRADRFPTPDTSCTGDSAPSPAPSQYPSCAGDSSSTPPVSAPARMRPSDRKAIPTAPRLPPLKRHPR